MQLSRFAFGLAAAAALALVRCAHVADQAPPVNVPGIDKPVIVVTGDVTANETWTSANYYVLRGAVFVRHGGTLNIQAGTRIDRRVRQRRHADRRARRPDQRHRHRGGADRVHERPAGRPARPRRLGRHHHQRPRADQLRQRRGRGRGRYRRLRRHRSERQQRHPAVCARRVLPASSSARTTS